MSTDRATQVPLIERLQSVPANAVFRVDTPNALGCMDTRSIPVGPWCHEAAAALRSALEAQQAPEVGASVRALNALEVLDRAALGSESQGSAAQFLKCLGEADLFVIENPLAASTESVPVALQAQAVEMARRFHEAYERLAPQFGYATREDTRDFDPESANGRLMIAVCAEIAPPQQPALPQGWKAVPLEPTEAMWTAGRDPVMYRDVGYHVPESMEAPPWRINPSTGAVERDQSKGTTAVHVWRAMLAASPEMPKE